MKNCRYLWSVIFVLVLAISSCIYGAEATQPTTWKFLAVIFKNTDFNFTTRSGEQWIEKNTMSDEEINIIIKMTEHFKHDLTEDSHGKIKAEVDVKVIDTPITKLVPYEDTDGFVEVEHIYELIKDTVDINAYDHITAITNLNRSSTYFGIGGMIFNQNTGYSFINTQNKDYCLWVFDETKIWPPAVMVHEFLHFMETWSSRLSLKIPFSLHEASDRGYTNENEWRAWYIDFINQQVPLSSNRKGGVSEKVWQLPPRTYRANQANGYENGIKPEFARTITDQDATYTWYGSAYKKNEATFTLTDLETSIAGGVWLNQPINTKNNFTVTFSYYAGEGRGDYWDGADGIVLAFNDKDHQTGYREDMDFISQGGYSVELDSYPRDSGDPEKKHIAITANGASNHLAYLEDDRVDDSKWHQVKVDCIDHSLIVYLDGERVLSSDNIIFKDDSIYVGLYARTGSGKNRHEISNLTVTEGEPAKELTTSTNTTNQTNESTTSTNTTNQTNEPTTGTNTTNQTNEPTTSTNATNQTNEPTTGTNAINQTNEPTTSYSSKIETITSTPLQQTIPTTSQSRIIKFKIGESKYTLNGQSIAMDAASYIQNPGFTMVPIRYVAEALGVPSKDITFSNGTVTIQMNSRTIQLTNNSDIAKVNGAEVKIGTKVVIEKGRTYAPIGEVAQLLGVAKEWDNTTKTATFIN